VRRFTSISLADLKRYTEITLQNPLNRQYILRLFVENRERELQREDNQTWTPVQRLYVPRFLITYTP